MTEELWTPEEVAQRWRMQKRTVMDMLRRGELKAFKVGRIWRIYYSDVLRYEKERENDKRMNQPEVAAMPRPVIGIKNEDELSRKMYSVAYRVTKAECLDLPPETFVTRSVELSPAERKHYDELRIASVTELSQEAKVEATSVLTKLLRLQQAAGGFLKADDSERVTQIGSSKLDALSDIVEDYVLGEGRKLVIFARFLPEIAGIGELLRSKGIRYGRITGDVPLQDRGEIVEDFQTNPETMCFVAQLQTAGLGITLHAASTAVFYSVGYNLADYQQALARIHRKGQTQPCTYILLQAERTVDQKIMEALDKKSDIARRIVDDWQQYFE